MNLDNYIERFYQQLNAHSSYTYIRLNLKDVKRQL